MAALLPHTELRSAPDGYAVLADGRPTQGTEARAKVLAGVGGTAITFAAFKALSASERRELYRAHKVLYVFHNRIDSAGDKADTERLTFEEVEGAQRELVDLVKMLNSANAYNIFITADHGFLYQDDPLPDPMFLSEPPAGRSSRRSRASSSGATCRTDPDTSPSLTRRRHERTGSRSRWRDPCSGFGSAGPGHGTSMAGLRCRRSSSR
ncbi:PglZ domain-containing protein [Oerskovia sp. M15]